MDKRKKITLLMFILIMLLLLISSCSGSWHLRQAVKKGIVVKSDTVYTEVITPGSTTAVHDTVPKFVDRIKYDTFKTETTKWKLKLKYDTITKVVYTQVECLPDTIKVPTYVNNDYDKAIKKDFPWTWLFIAIVAVCGLIILLKILK